MVEITQEAFANLEIQNKIKAIKGILQGTVVLKESKNKWMK